MLLKNKYFSQVTLKFLKIVQIIVIFQLRHYVTEHQIILATTSLIELVGAFF